MTRCGLCKCRFEDELFIPAVMDGRQILACPLCTTLERNRYHGLPDANLPSGEIAGSLVLEAAEALAERGLLSGHRAEVVAVAALEAVL